jgi:hypothetical protein
MFNEKNKDPKSTTFIIERENKNKIAREQQVSFP